LIYAAWNISHSDLPNRSYLYSLPPIGIGTPAVEGLTGYISRLAETHGVGVGTLVHHILLPRIPRTNGLFAGQPRSKSRRWWIFEGAHTLNGVGVCPKHWVSALEELTGVEHLDLLTVLPWADWLSRVHLLRTTRTWCPDCYQGWLTAGVPVYEPLLWMFQIVTVCPMHRRALEQNCPHCGRTQYVFSSKSRPGFCSRCQSWLVPNQNAATGLGTTDDSLSEQIWVAEKVCELLAANQWISTRANGDIFRENVRQLINAAECTLKLLHEITQVNVRVLLSNTGMPRIDTLLKLCRCWRISPLRLMTEPISVNDQVWHCPHIGSRRIAKQPPTAATGLRARLRRSAAVPTALVQRRLEDALAKDSYTTLGEVAASLGLPSIRRFYREKSLCDLAHAIAAKNAALKNRDYIVENHGTDEPSNASSASLYVEARRRTCVSRTVVLSTLKDALAKDSCILLREVAASLGLQTIRRFYADQRSSELAHAIAAKNARLRRRSTESLGTHPASTCSDSSHFAGVPRSVVRKALEEALAKDSYARLKAVAASVGLNNTKRFYMEKPLSDLAHAIAAKNAEIKRRGNTREEPALTEALNRVMASLRAKIKRVPRAIVQKGLEDALTKDNTYTSLRGLARSLGLRSEARFYRDKSLSDLAHAVVVKNTQLWKGACNIKDAKNLPGVPRDVVWRALEEALAKDSYTTVGSVATSLGLRSTRRLYKEKCLSDLSHAIAAKNAAIKKRHYDEVRLSLATAVTENPERSIVDVARQVNKKAGPITGRVPKAKPARPSDPPGFLRACWQAHRLNKAHRELEAALLEEPAPALSTVLKRLHIGPETVQQMFPRLRWRIRDRYIQQTADARAQEHKAFTADVREALRLLQHANVQPTFRRLLACIKHPRFRGRKIVCNAISLAQEELAAGSQTACPNLSPDIDGHSIPCRRELPGSIANAERFLKSGSFDVRLEA
jgi:ATP-dependent protease HslVU (ClpYQ) peptidase subunit